MGSGIKVAIADSSDSFREMLAELVESESDMEVAATAGDGVEALELVCSQKPDVLVTDLMLREMDGLCLMRSLRERDALPHTLVVSGFFNDHLAETVSHLGAEYFYPKPCSIDGLIAGIRACMLPSEQERGEKALDRMVCNMISSFGIMPHLSGFVYLKAGIMMISSGRCPLKGVTKILYPDLAKKYSSSALRVERCIRHAIQVAWEEGDAAEREHYFGAAFRHFQRAPTNSELLAILVERVDAELYAEKNTL